MERMYIMKRTDAADMTEHTLKKNEIFRGRIFTAYDDEVTLPNGNTSRREYVSHRGGVCCAALNDKNELAFVSQYRYAYGQVVTELPAGKLEKGEDPDDAIRRELREEVGAEGTGWRSMGTLYPSPGYCNEVIHLYACRIGEVGEQQPDEDECLEVEFIPLEKAVEMVMAGQLPDSKTQVLVLKTAELMRRGEIL